MFQTGSSHKFRRATVRVGSAGQLVVNQFESEERALREMGKLVGEKLRKGYTEAEG